MISRTSKRNLKKMQEIRIVRKERDVRYRAICRELKERRDSLRREIQYSSYTPPIKPSRNLPINDCIKNKTDTGNPVLNSLLRIFYS